MTRYRVRLTLLSIVYLATLVATLVGVSSTQRPWSLVVLVVGAVVIAMVYVLLFRTLRPAKPKPAEVEPDPWSPTRAAIRTQPTAELLAMHREIRRYAALGSAVQLHEEVFEPAIRAELARRGVRPCSCPTPDGPHTDTCQETR